MSTQGFLDLTETDASPADSEPGVAELLAAVRANVSRRPENLRLGSFAVNPGQTALIVDGDPSRARAGVAVAAAVSGVAVTTLAFVSDRWIDAGGVGGLRYVEGAQLPVLANGEGYLIFESTSPLYVTVPTTANAPVYVSFFAESYSAA